MRNGAYNSGCSSDCTICGYCGDGIVDKPQEQCDLGWKLNGTPGANCTANCTLVTPTDPCPYECGNGILEPGEQCDDGKHKNGNPQLSRCSRNCTWTSGPKCGNGITEWPEECDDGKDLNGTPSSKCSETCTLKEPCGPPRPPVCGNGIVEAGEECDAGYLNGTPGSTCTKTCTRTGPCGSAGKCQRECGNGVIEEGEECDDGARLNGTPASDCDAACKRKTPPGHCATCNPNPFFNKCTITTSCISTVGDPAKRNYCACRAGYRASGLSPTDTRQFRLEMPGQEYRVFVAPGVDCDELCLSPFPGPESCKEVPVRADC